MPRALRIEYEGALYHGVVEGSVIHIDTFDGGRDGD